VRGDAAIILERHKALSDGVKPACDAARVETGGYGGCLRRDGSALVDVAALREDVGEADQVAGMVAGIRDRLTERKRGAGGVLGRGVVADRQGDAMLLTAELRLVVLRRRRVKRRSSQPLRSSSTSGRLTTDWRSRPRRIDSPSSATTTPWTPQLDQLSCDVQHGRLVSALQQKERAMSTIRTFDVTCVTS